MNENIFIDVNECDLSCSSNSVKDLNFNNECEEYYTNNAITNYPKFLLSDFELKKNYEDSVLKILNDYTRLKLENPQSSE